VGDVIRAHAAHLIHVHLDDIRGGVHEHRLFGEGDLDLGAALTALKDIGYDGMAAVELSRDSHRGAWVAGESMKRLQAANVNTTRPCE
jgi:sugar phosphate isomerase/epimerase